jgi:hypothetical protein
MKETSIRLARLIEREEGALAGFSESATSAPTKAEGWSRKEILGHLIDSASNNHQRFVRALLADELRFPAYDTPGNVRVQRYQYAAWGQLLGLWAAYNRLLVHVIAQIPEDKLATTCWIGANPPMALGELAEDYVRHLEHHLDQLR